MPTSNLLYSLALSAIPFLFVQLGEAQTPEARTPANRILQLSGRGGGGSIESPQGWFPHHYANLHELWSVAPEKLAGLSPEEREDVARIETAVIDCKDHAEAVQRLKVIEAEWGMTSKFITIGGWPALQRRQLVPKPSEGDARGGAPEMMFMVTTAVAVDATLVRMDGFAPEDASTDILDQIESIGRALRPQVAGDAAKATQEAEQLRQSPSLRVPPGPTPIAAANPGSSIAVVAANAGARSGAAALNAPTPGGATNLGTFNLNLGSESEIAVSTNGTNIVIGQQCGFRTSQDGGVTFPFSGGAPGRCTGGDASVAFGRSGNFYYSTIGSNVATCPAASPNCNNTQQMARSTNNGQTFQFVTNVIDCLVTAGCGFGNIPDQEHIAADRFNASGSGGDQVYLAFRKGFGYGISCSTDSGANWTAVSFHTGGSIDFPRMTVAPNGTLFVVTNNGNNINLDSFASCNSGFAQNLNQVNIASGINEVACPVAGLDRCNDGNILSSHTVAVDDTNSNHLYAAYAVNTAAGNPGNDNVLVRDSTNGGTTWSAAVQVSQGGGGRRFEPWVCATGGTAFVSWFDRRNATAGSNDLTDYFSSSAFRNGGGLNAGNDFRISGASDPECASGWPCQTRSTMDSESCSTQPQLAGVCRHTPNNNTDSFTACDFSSTVCPVGETCQGGGGCPKYGDYTGNACLLGRLYNVWPSATNQPGAAGTGGFINSFFVETVVTSTPTTTTYTGITSQEFHHVVAAVATLTLFGTSVPVTGQNITFTLGSQSCSAATNSAGVASCNITITQIPGAYTMTASFTGAGNFQASSNSVPFTITKEATTVTYNGDTIVGNGNPAIMSGVLLEDLGVPIAGRTITFTLGTGGGAQTCNGLTDGTGTATCIIIVNQPFGARPIDVEFAGDAFYLPSSASASLFVPEPPRITKSFADAQVEYLFGFTRLTFTILNPNPIPLAAIAVSDPLPSGLIVLPPDNGLMSTCTGATISAVPASSTISLSGLNLAANASCTFSALVNGVSIGEQDNVTSNITSTTGKGLTGAPAMDTTFVVFTEFMWFF